ncbi:lytic murein transglycosylase, partial [Ideonella sp.]|uniref:lytic murein transglycosylase n=1 Tax=Ideonella sp. TaxID=1929293 RepID=UPI003BB67030
MRLSFRLAWITSTAAGLVACNSVSLAEPPSPAASSTAAGYAAASALASSAPVSVPVPVPAGTLEATNPPAFDAWVAGLRSEARAAGIAEATLREALSDLRYLPRLVAQDRAQPEFSRPPWAYLDSAVTPLRIQNGQQKWQALREPAQAAADRYGVPPSIVMAIWGVESNYGSNYGNTPTLDALATLGFDGRREAWARGQLLAALKILQNGDIARAQMIGSWAGAMGQTQFLPSAFLAHAVDADGDGRRDIWGSPADVIASTANFLARSGWQAGQPWGLEVRLPASFDLARADGALRLSSQRWAEDGVQAMDGRPLPDLPDAALLLPAGARGPAFMVGANFRSLLRYNNSTSYALAVGLLAAGIEGGPGVQAAWPRDLVMLSRSQMTALQTALNQRGFASGTADGVMGPATRDAVRRYQRSLGLPADGYPD